MSKIISPCREGEGEGGDFPEDISSQNIPTSYLVQIPLLEQCLHTPSQNFSAGFLQQDEAIDNRDTSLELDLGTRRGNRATVMDGRIRILEVR